MPRAWVRQRKQEYYYRKAKEDKFRSRAAYKLMQAVRKHEFLKPGDIVVDLGAAPGGWMQVCRMIVGDKGFVLGVDLRTIEPLHVSNAETIVVDITSDEALDQIRKALPSQADSLISDVSPKVSGAWEVDHARQVDLALKSMDLARELTRHDGSFFVKVFQGDLFPDFMKKARQHYTWVKILKPKASRPRSAEVFVLALGLKKGS